MARFKKHIDSYAADLLEHREVTPLDVVLAETVARHFEGATVQGSVALVGLGDVRIACEVADGHESAAGWSVALFFRLWGGLLGPVPVFASISGYDTTREGAVVEGGSLWSGSFGPVLRSGLAGLPDADPELKVRLEVFQGTHVRLAQAALGRVMSATGLTDAEQAGHLTAARQKLAGAGTLTEAVLAWPGFPDVKLKHSALVSVFVLDSPTGRTVEVKVNGDNLRADDALPAAPPSPEGVTSLLRELAVLTRVGPGVSGLGGLLS